jgi:hypothetical protein
VGSENFIAGPTVGVEGSNWTGGNRVWVRSQDKSGMRAAKDAVTMGRSTPGKAGARPCDPERDKGELGSSGRLACVAVMESTEQGQGDDVASVGWFNGARCRSILVERPVGTVLMIIAEVIRELLA